MKKIKYGILTIIVVIIGLVGCGGNDDYESIIQKALDSISFPDIVTSDLDFKNGISSGKYTVLLTYETSDSKIISYSGKVTRTNYDEDISITVTGKIDKIEASKRKFFDVTVKKKEFQPEDLEIGDVDANRVIKNELNTALANYNKKLNEANYLSLSSNMVVNGESSQSYVKAINSPIYLETYTNGTNDREILAEEDGKIFSYKQQSNSYIERKYQCKVEDFDLSDDSSMDTDAIFAYDINPTKGSYTKYGDKFTIKSYFKDALSKEERDQIAAIYIELGISTTQLYYSIMTMTYTINDNAVKFEYDLSVSLEVGDIAIPISIQMKTAIDISSFEPMTYDETIYTISAPTCIEEVRYFTDIMNDGYELKNRKDFIKVNLVANQYAFEETTGRYEVRVYGEDGNEINVGLVNPYSSLVHKKTFVIPKDGVYYFELDSNSSDSINLSLSVCDYETYYDLDNSLTLGTSTGSIEGEFDFVSYKYISDETKLLKFTNTGTQNLYLLCHKYESDYFQLWELKPLDELYAGIYSKDNYFILMSGENNEAYSYSFFCEEVDQSAGIEENYEDYDEITEEESTKTYISGYGQKDKNLKLIVRERGLYTINFKGQVLVYEKDTMNSILYSTGYESFILKEGEYIVRLTNNNHVLSISTISYTFESLEDKEVDVNLPTLTTFDECSWIISKKITDEQIVKYKFELNESAIIMFRSGITIYDNQGAILSLNTNSNSHYNYDYMKLEAGRYYFQSDEKKNNNIIIAISTYENIPYLDYNNLEELPFGEQLILESSNGKMYFKITLEEKTSFVINLTYGKAYVFNEDKECYSYRESGKYTLYEGVYYLVIELSVWYDDSLTVTKN